MSTGEDGSERFSSRASFNLTSAAGLATAAAFLARGGATVAAASPVAPIAVPICAAIVAILVAFEAKRTQDKDRKPEKAGDEEFRQAGATVSPAPAASAQREQQAVAEAILAKSKEMGLSEVTVTLESSPVIDAGLKLPKATNVDVRFKVGKTTKTIIHAKWPNKDGIRSVK